ncbi:MAG: ABC transporter ATP-binding protein/permease [Betaproteobacteria bacterium]|nr:ABC transporter ATP-binding protein/permease [Betaproteobacteria bacterium]
MQRHLLIHGASFLSNLWQLIKPYWNSEERWRARGLLAAIVGLTLGLVFMAVQFNDWNRGFYNSLEQKNFEDFKDLLLYFFFLATGYIVLAVYKLYLMQMLEMRWRAWLTREYLAEWLDKQVYYRLELQHRGTDNPDQRIAEDLRLFTDGTLTLSLGLLSSVVTLVSFIAILWSVSGPLTFMLGESDITLPGYMVWVAILYAAVASVLTHYIGRPLIGISFRKERLEADFRFSMVRLREHAEGIALYHGEQSERRGLLERFEHIRANWWDVMRYTKRLTGFTAGYTQIAVVFPYVVAAPRFFSGAITLGGLTQISNAFAEVQGSLSWFVNAYGMLAGWKASVDRLITFQGALQETTREADDARGIRGDSGGETLKVEHLDLALPPGAEGTARVIVADGCFEIAAGEKVLLTGPSGSGKSTLFRAIAGIWPYGRGSIHLPAGARVLFLPQKPYLPIGSLRDVVTFPSPAGSFSEAVLSEALRAVHLAAHAERLDEVSNWSMSMSGGEQQRLAMARVLLNKPDWLFLDEATASLDEANESLLYTLLRERLPDAMVMSIAHRAQVAGFHGKRLVLEPGEGGRMSLHAA